MNFKDYIVTNCRESSIHGLKYLVKRELHWSEKLFWAAMVLLATYFSIDICLNQYQRFRENPIVLATEFTWGMGMVPNAGLTLCSDYYEDADKEALMEDLWHDVKNTTKYQYYSEFLEVLNKLQYDRLNTLAPYENDTTLAKLNFLDILTRMRKSVLYANTKYAPAITEVGLCRTTSQMSEYLSPFKNHTPLPEDSIVFCSELVMCNMEVHPISSDNTILRLYLHNAYEVVSTNHRSTIKREITPVGSATIELLLGFTVAESEVRNIPINYRKCRYPDENNLKYFKHYRPSLCRMECHIDAALKMCNCKPYFYAVGSALPVCNIKGLLCLAGKNWTAVSCSCVPLCEDFTYSSTHSRQQTDDSFKFQRVIIVNLVLPRMGIKRRVVFSTDQLVMSFGGAIGLYMGASFISAYGLIYIFSEYVTSNLSALWKKYQHRHRHQQIYNANEIDMQQLRIQNI